MPGNRLPAEWEKQSGVMLTWPHSDTDWYDILEAAEAVYLEIARAIVADEQLLLVCRDPGHREHVLAKLAKAGVARERIIVALADSNDTWARDHGPVTTLDDAGVPTLHDFVFDGWGGKYAADKDTRINAALGEQRVFGDSVMRPHELVLEGGAIETEGQGTLLATRSSVLDSRRNPDLSNAAIEQLLRDTLGLTRFLWLEHGELTGDDTDAHIDVLARFTDPGTIVYSTAPTGDADHAALAAMEQQLRGFRTRDGNPYQLIPLPFPGIHRDSEGRRLPAGYANFLIINSSLLLPVYGVPADREAEAILAQCFPDRRVVPIDCRALIAQNGSLHCVSMQFPAAVPMGSGHSSRKNGEDTTG